MTTADQAQDLAVLGGARAFAEPLHVGRPNLGDRAAFTRMVEDVLDRRWLTNDGPLVREFEEQVASISEARHCIAVANGTLAATLLLDTMGLRGSAVVPSFTFIATPHAAEWAGLDAVFADIEEDTHHLYQSSVTSALTHETAVVVGVHLWGGILDAKSLDISELDGIPLVYDAAHAFGSTLHGRGIGAHGVASTLSFHATKFINTFEGGAVLTDDDALAAELRLRRNFGFAGYDEVTRLGTNAKLNEVSAAQGLSMLAVMQHIVEHNHAVLERYRNRLAQVPGITLWDPGATRTNGQYVVTQVDAEEFGLSRDELVDALWADNVRARRYFYPGCHRMSPYRERGSDVADSLQATERVAKQVMVLPTGTAMTLADVTVVCDLIARAHDRAPAIGRALRAP